MLRHMKISTKLIFGFGIVLLLTGLIGWVGLNGINTNNKLADQVVRLDKQDAFFLEKEIDHFKWMAQVDAFFLTPTQQFIDVETDDHKCGLGRFIYGEQAQELAAQDSDIDRLIEEIKAPHQWLHESVIKINEQYKTSGDKQAVLRIKEQETIPSMKQVQAILKDIRGELAADVEQNQQIMSSGTQQTNTTVVAALVAAIVLGFIIAIAMTRSITTSIHKVNEVAHEIADGDLSVQFMMGKTTNCSHIKQCGQRDCPSFGKEAYCWVEAGSFSKSPSCPSALRGEDCRQCILYQKSVNTEMEEMGSELNAMIEALKQKADTIEQIAQGDLTVEVKLASNKDGLGKSLTKMRSSLHDILSQVNISVDQVAAGADQVSSASQSLSQGATEQASSVQEITSSLTEINSQAKQNADNATQANELAKNSMENADSGNTQMKELIQAMEEINQSSDEIKKIMKVIDDIAFQINLLALNANVEAARAGKYGKGFAVVAEEVRNLAVKSADSVKTINQMVEESINRVDNGNALVEKTAGQLEEIVTGASKMADLVEEIAIASREQAQGLEQVNSGLEQIDQVTQSNTANAEETASAAEELASQAQQVKAMVERFKLSKNGQDDMAYKIANSRALISKLLQASQPKQIGVEAGTAG